MAYEIVPYTVKVKVQGVAEEFRPLSDIDNAGTSLAEVVARSGQAHMRQLRAETAVAERSMEVQDVFRDGHCAMLQLGSGQSGIQATIRQRRKAGLQRVDVKEEDTTSVALRHVFFYAPGAKVGILLVERVGNHGSLTNLNSLISANLRAHFSTLSLEVRPAMSTEVMERWAKQAKLKAFVLERVHTATGEKHELRGMATSQVMRFGAPRRRSWSLGKNGLSELDQRELLTELVPLIPNNATQQDVDAAVDALLEEGWRVSVELHRAGRRRTVEVKTKAGITMTFPAGSDETSRLRPENAQFQEACQEALRQLADDITGLGTMDPAACAWSTETWHDDSNWKAVWGVSIDEEPAEGPA